MFHVSLIGTYLFHLFIIKRIMRMQNLNKELKNFEPPICYMVEQKATTQGIRMSKGIELILVTRQETVVLPRAKPIVAQGVLMVFRIRYSEPIIN